MAEVLNNIEELVDKNEKLIDIWGRRNPKFEIKYEKTVMRAIVSVSAFIPCIIQKKTVTAD